jgi:hypothetical protein
MSHFVAMHCTPEREDFQRRHPQAWLLLCQIAARARWKAEPCPVTGLKHGQCRIGDWKTAGMRSAKAYVCAKRALVRVGAAAFEGKNQGTIATLVTDPTEPSFFSIAAPSRGNPEDNPEGRRGTTQGQARGKRGATKAQGYSEHHDHRSQSLSAEQLGKRGVTS